MFKKFFIFIWISVLLISCENALRNANHELLRIDNLLETSLDSAEIAFESINPDLLNNFDRSYYSILLIAIQSKKGESLVDLDKMVDEAIHFFSKKKDLQLLARAYLYKSRIWNELKEDQKAINILQKAIDLLIKNKVENKEILAKIYDDLGNIYSDKYLFDLALEIFRKEYDIDYEMNNPKGMFYSLKNIGETFLMKDDLDSAYYYLMEASNYANQFSIDSNGSLDYLYNTMAIYYDLKDQYDIALECLDKISHKNQNFDFNKATILIKQQQYEMALPILLNMVDSKDIEIKTASYLQLGEIEYNKGNYKNAFNYYKKYIECLDVIHSESKYKELKILDYKYNLERETFKIKNKTSQNILLLIFFFILIVLLMVFFYFFKRKQQQIKENEKNNLLLQKEKEIFRLTEEFLILQNDLTCLKQKNNNTADYEEKIKRKEEIIAKLKEDIEIKRFMMKSVYDRLLEVDHQIIIGKTESIKPNEFESLFKELELSFPQLISRIRTEYPHIKKDSIFILCLSYFGFKSKTIALILNITDVTVRQRIARLKPKLPEFFKEK